jgi:transposase
MLSRARPRPLCRRSPASPNWQQPSGICARGGADSSAASTDGRLALDNNAAERALRGVAIGRKNWLFAGSDRGGARAAARYSLIESAKLNGLDPQTYLTDILTRLATHPAKRIADRLPWNWTPPTIVRHAA